jgi:hypothetical protein
MEHIYTYIHHYGYEHIIASQSYIDNIIIYRYIVICRYLCDGSDDDDNNDDDDDDDGIYFIELQGSIWDKKVIL